MSNEAICQICWAKGQQVGKPCWLCHNVVAEPLHNVPFVARAVDPTAAIPVSVVDDNPYVGPAIAATTTGYRSTGVLLIVTVVLVGIALAVVAPGLGIPASVIVVPALIRTLINLKKKRSQGIEITTGDRVSTFLISAAASTAAVVTAAVAIVCTFFSACLIVCAGMGTGANFGDEFFMIMVGGGVLVAIGVGVYMFFHLSAEWE